MAKVLARSAGAVSGGPTGFSADTDAQRAANLAWARRVLETLALRDVDDPTAQAELAEVLAHTDPPAAWRTLASLEARQLMPSAHAYRTLLELRRRRAQDRSPWMSVVAETAEAPIVAVERARCVTMATEEQLCALDGA